MCVRRADVCSGANRAHQRNVEKNRMKKFVSVCCLVLSGVFVAAQIAAAQGTAASIRGTVVDPSGALVSNAALTATQTETGLAREVSSDAHGDYIFVELPIGHYRLEAQA